jgi:hypothetical protein
VAGIAKELLTVGIAALLVEGNEPVTQVKFHACMLSMLNYLKRVVTCAAEN